MPPFSIAGVVPKAALYGAAETHARMDEESFRLFYERTARPLRGYRVLSARLRKVKCHAEPACARSLAGFTRMKSWSHLM